MIKSAATTADVVKIWFDRLNVSVSRILSTINVVRSDSRAFAQIESQSRFINGSLDFVKDSITDKVENYLRNTKQFKGNHPYIRACNGVIRLSDMVADRLKKAVNAQNDYLEAFEDQDDDQDIKLLNANRAWEITVEAAQKLSEQINILGKNVLNEFSAQDFSPPGQPQLAPGTPRSQPVRQQLATNIRTSFTFQLKPEQVPALLNYLKGAPNFLKEMYKKDPDTNLVGHVSKLSPEEKKSYESIKNVCIILHQYYFAVLKSTAPTNKTQYEPLLNITGTLMQINEKLNVDNIKDAIPKMEAFNNLVSPNMTSQQPADAQPGQETTAQTSSEATLEQSKEYGKTILKFVNERSQDIINNYKSNEQNFKNFWKKNTKVTKDNKLQFDKAADASLLFKYIDDSIKNLIRIQGVCNNWVSRYENVDSALNLIISGIKTEAFNIVEKFKKIKEIWTKKEEVTDYPSTVEQVKQLNETADKELKKIESKAETTTQEKEALIKNKLINKLASQIHSAVEHFGHLVSLAKKQSGVATKTNPSLWSRCKSEAKSRMGGKHSARAMQLAVKLYKQRGGGYKGKKPTARTNKMKKWTKQKWMYLSDYKKKKKKDKNKLDDHLIEDTYFDSVSEDENDAKGRYLPEAKWKSLSPKERSATDQKKKRQGKNKQYVSNTEAAKVKSKAKYY